MPYDFTKSQSDKKSSSSSSSSAPARPSLGSGAAEKAAKAIEERKNTIDEQLKKYGA